MTDTERHPARALMGIAIKLVVILGVAYGASQLMDWVIAKAEHMSPGSQTFMLTTLLVLILIGYAFLMSLPFVPGIEIGISLLIMRGPEMAPYVYLATVIGLWVGFFYGRYMPYAWLTRMLSDLRLKRASAYVDELEALTPEARIQLLCDRMPEWLGTRLVAWRYIVVGIMFNIPGNAVIGGGGGIALLAGLSRVFETPKMMLTIAIAVIPFPLFVWVFGIEFLK